jgi:hypothetical protein
MGASFPAVARWAETTPNGVSWLGAFYSANIAGAVLGCVLSGFYLLRLYDMATATYTAAAINAAVMLAGLALAWGASGQTPVPRSREAQDGRRAQLLVYVAIGLAYRAWRRSAFGPIAFAVASRPCIRSRSSLRSFLWIMGRQRQSFLVRRIQQPD